MWNIKGKKWEERGERERVCSVTLPWLFSDIILSYQIFRATDGLIWNSQQPVKNVQVYSVPPRMQVFSSTFSEVERCHLLLHNLTDSFRLQDTAYKTEMAWGGVFSLRFCSTERLRHYHILY